jgi:hypothetical protein
MQIEAVFWCFLLVIWAISGAVHTVLLWHDFQGDVQCATITVWSIQVAKTAEQFDGGCIVHDWVLQQPYNQHNNKHGDQIGRFSGEDLLRVF